MRRESTIRTKLFPRLLVLGVLLASALLPSALSARLPPPAHQPYVPTAEAVEGRDTATIELPPGIVVENYANVGYRLTLRDGVPQIAEVEVAVEPLESRAPFALPKLDRRRKRALARGEDPILRLARGLTSAASTQYEASSRILAWVAENISYRLDRSLSQSAHDVLRRGDAYCTGVARLAAALHLAVGLEAREVAGWDASRHGFHRWIEVRLDDRGWVYSDPLTAHHWVPATLVRLADDRVRMPEKTEGRVLERRNFVVAVDLHPYAGEGVRARRNSSLRRAGALTVELEEPLSGEAVLKGWTVSWHREIFRGKATFLGLVPGRYDVHLQIPGRPEVRRTVELEDRARQVLFLPNAVLREARTESPKDRPQD